MPKELPSARHGDIHAGSRNERRVKRDQELKNSNSKPESTPTPSAHQFYKQNFGKYFSKLRGINFRNEPDEAAKAYVLAQLIANKKCSNLIELFAEYKLAVLSGEVAIIENIAKESKCFPALIDRLISENRDLLDRGL